MSVCDWWRYKRSCSAVYPTLSAFPYQSAFYHWSVYSSVTMRSSSLTRLSLVKQCWRHNLIYKLVQSTSKFRRKKKKLGEAFIVVVWTAKSSSDPFIQGVLLSRDCAPWIGTLRRCVETHIPCSCTVLSPVTHWQTLVVTIRLLIRDLFGKDRDCTTD